MAAAGVPVAPGTTDPAADRRGRRWPPRRRSATRSWSRPRPAAAAWAWPSPPTRRRCATEYEKVRGFAERMFGDGSVLIERYFPRVRHIEVQILGPGRRPGRRARRAGVLGAAAQPEAGRGVAVARRSTPSCARGLLAAAVRAGEAVGYRNAGTVECLLDPATGEFFFLEMNTRLQVEHPVTERSSASTWSRSSCGSPPACRRRSTRTRWRPRGHAIELRINAEDPKRFLPGPGAITTWVEPTGEGVRVDSGYAAGHHRHAVLRLADGQADRATAPTGPRRSPGPGPRSPASRSSGRRTTCRSSPSCWTTPSSSPATTTPASSAGCGDGRADG